METFNPIILIHRCATVILVGASMVTSMNAGEPADGRNLAELEQSRRSAGMQEAQELLIKGDDAYNTAKYAEAVEAFAGARELLPDAPVSAELRAAATERYVLASVEYARILSRNGDVAGAKAAVDKVLLGGVAPNHPGALAYRAQLDDPIRTNPALTPEYTKDVDAVRRLLYMAEGAYNLGKLDEAKIQYQKILRIDPTNTAARRGMEQLASTRSNYDKAAQDHTRAEMLSKVDAAWETALVAPDLGDMPLDPSGPAPLKEVVSISAKLDRIIIPKINLDQASLQESLDFLRSRSIESDLLEQDPSLKGVNFTLNLGSPDSEISKSILARKFDLQLNGVPLSKVLKYLTELTHTSFTTDDFSVIITPLGSSSDELISRSYRVPPDFISSMGNGTEGGAGKEDPFAADTPNKGLLKTRLTAKEALLKQGIPFPTGALASYSPHSNILQVVNTAVNQDMISQLAQAATNTEPVMVSVRVTMIKVQKTLLEELSFDTLITPVPLNSDNTVIGSGGTIGSGSPRTGGDFTAPMPGLPVIPTTPVQSGVLTNGLRSGGYAVSGSELDNIVNNLERTTQRSAVAPGIMAVTGLFSDGQVQTIMRGLNQKKGADIMSQPSTVTRSGQQATISIVREFIYPTDYEPPEIAQGVGGLNNNIGTVTPAMPQSFEKRDLGTVLEVLPVADADRRYIDITLNPSFSDLDGFVNYGTPINSIVTDPITGQTQAVEVTKNAILMPVFNVQRLNTQLSVADGSTIAIGGLMSESIQNVEDKVPVLGAIPLVGRMFTSKVKQPISTAIIFLIHVELLDPTGRPYRDR